MNANSKRLGIYLAVTAVLTAIATTLRSIACVKHLDYRSGFFTDKSMIIAANIIMIVTAIGAFSYLFVAPRIKLIASFSTSATYVTTGVLGVATAFLGTKAISFATIASRYSAYSQKTQGRDSTLVILGIVCALLAFASIAHHFFNAFITESKAEIRAYFAIASIAFLALYAMLIYLDPSLSIGESTKVLRLIAFLSASLFFLYEARISLGREMWRIYTSFGMAAAALCAYASIPAIIAYFTNDTLVSYANRRSLVSIEEYMLLLALFIFIGARLIITVALQEETENKYIKTLKDFATDRERQVAESSARYNEIFASKQLSIFDLYGGEIIVDEEENSEDEEVAPVEEAVKQPMISDDAIYESIFGRMPEKDEEPEGEPEEVVEEDEEPVDDREPEEIAAQILNSYESVIYSAEKGENEAEI